MVHSPRGERFRPEKLEAANPSFCRGWTQKNLSISCLHMNRPAVSIGSALQMILGMAMFRLVPT